MSMRLVLIEMQESVGFFSLALILVIVLVFNQAFITLKLIEKHTNVSRTDYGNHFKDYLSIFCCFFGYLLQKPDSELGIAMRHYISYSLYFSAFTFNCKPIVGKLANSLSEKGIKTIFIFLTCLFMYGLFLLLKAFW